MSSRRSNFSTAKSQLSVRDRRAVNLSDEEVEAIIQGFAEEDEYSNKTWSRRIVENYLSKVRVRGQPPLFIKTKCTFAIELTFDFSR